MTGPLLKAWIWLGPGAHQRQRCKELGYQYGKPGCIEASLNANYESKTVEMSNLIV